MANSSTLLGSAGSNMSYFQAGVVAYTVVLDTINADLVIDTPASDERSAIVGLIYSEPLAHDLTIKSGSTTLCVIENALNAATNVHPLGAGILGASINRGDTIVLRTTVAITAQILVYVARFKQLCIA